MATPTAMPPGPSVQSTIPAEQSEFPVIAPGYTYEAVEKQVDDIVIARPITLG
jgi:hypothetical protein